MSYFITPLLSAFLLETALHTGKGNYDEKVLQLIMKDRPDSELFLAPYFKRDLENLNNERILDAGCGTALWSIYAASNGGEVYAIDIQEGMIQAAKKAVQSAHLTNRVSIVRGDVASLPYNDHFFDKAISMCVACNLTPDSFKKHFDEFRRTLKEDGIAVVGSAFSNDVVFTNGTRNDEEVTLQIQSVLKELPDNPPPVKNGSD
jgi:ubiquinone/menaquinone biosynthesis C-methylase UbiE